MNKYMEKFQKKNNWVKYCNDARERRIKKLVEQGCTNPYAVVANGYKPKFVSDLKTKVCKEGKVLIPVYIRRKMNLKEGDIFEISFEKNEIRLILKEDKND